MRATEAIRASARHVIQTSTTIAIRSTPPVHRATGEPAFLLAVLWLRMGHPVVPASRALAFIVGLSVCAMRRPVDAQEHQPAARGNAGLSALLGSVGDMSKLLSSFGGGRRQPGAPRLRHPVALLPLPRGQFLVSSFMSNQVLKGTIPAPVYPLDGGSGGFASAVWKGTDSALRLEEFAAGVYCPASQDAQGPLDLDRQTRTLFPSGPGGCAVLDGPWGLAAWRGVVLVASFGSDQVLAFRRQDGAYLGHLGDSRSLDSPEGLAVLPASSPSRSGGVGSGDELLVANFIAGSVSRFSLLTGQFKGFLVSAASKTLAGPEAITLVQAGPLAGTLVVASHWTNSVEAFDSRSGQHVGSLLWGPAREGRDASRSRSLLLNLELDQAEHGQQDSPMPVALRPANHSSLWAIDDARSRPHAHPLLRGPVGVAVDARGGRLLVSAYQSSAVLEVGLGGLSQTSTISAAKKGGLRGPSAVALLWDSTTIVASYDSHTLTVFNTTWSRRRQASSADM